MFNKSVIKIKNFFLGQNRKKLFKITVPSLILIIVFSFVALIPLFYGITSDGENTNKLIIESATKSLDDIFRIIDDVYKSVEGSLEGETLFGKGGIITLNSSDGYGEICSNMEKNISANSFIDEIIVLKKGEDVILTKEGAVSKRDFFLKNYVSDVYGMHFFDNLTTDYLNVKVIPAASYKNMEKYPEEDPKYLLSCVKRYNGTNINIVIFISRDRFVKAANLTHFGDQISFKIYDYNDSVVYSNSDSEYMINTTKISKDFENEIINLGFKKYYISKSDYNYFYYVAEVTDILFLLYILSVIILFSGFVLSVLWLMRAVGKIDKSAEPIFTELGISGEDVQIDEITGKIKEYKEKINENDDKISTIGDEIKSSIFLKTATSSSFYSRYKKTVDLVFSDILSGNFFFLLSVETIRENIKFPRYELNMLEEHLKKNDISFIQIEEKVKKYIYIISCHKDESDNLVKGLESVFDEIRSKNLEILICYSMEFTSFSNLYDSFRDIRICRDYRGINDMKSVLKKENITYGNHMYLPPNFKEELAGKIMAKEDVEIKKYIKEIFDTNIENNIPQSRFELMLRQMLNTVIDALSTDRKNSSDMYELEQMFLAGIEQHKENHDVYGIINNFINLIHLGINMYDSKKSTLNRTDVIKYINSNYTGDLYLEKVATRFGTTSKYFSNYFKKEFSVGFNEYLTSLRISRAKKLLVETSKSLFEISEEVGYSNQATFAAAFKKVIGIPPGKYRELNGRGEIS